MEKILVERYFAKISINLGQSLITQTFFDTAEAVQHEEFYDFMKSYVEIVLELQKSGKMQTLNTLVDTRKGDYIVVPEMQDRVNLELLAQIAGMVDKVAFLQPKDFFVQVSIEQMMDENIDKTTVTRYFDDESEALKWLIT